MRWYVGLQRENISWLTAQDFGLAWRGDAAVFSAKAISDGLVVDGKVEKNSTWLPVLLTPVALGNDKLLAGFGTMYVEKTRKSLKRVAGSLSESSVFRRCLLFWHKVRKSLDSVAGSLSESSAFRRFLLFWHEVRKSLKSVAGVFRRFFPLSWHKV